jgi:hypothetical protein
VIKIRYSVLPAGLHARAEAHGRSAIIYLLPGLTPGERRAALVRVRRSADMGYGPRLSPIGVAAAVARDQTGTTLRNGLGAFRSHPLLLFPTLVVLLSATLVYIMTTAVTITIRPPRAAGPGPRLGLTAVPHSRLPSRQAGDWTQPGGAVRPDPSISGPGGVRTQSPRPSRPSRPTSPSGSPSTGPTTTPPGLASPPPTTPTPTSTPSPAPSTPGTCLQLGPLGVCLRI